MRYLLNSAVITSPGTYHYHLVTADDAARWIQAGGWVSKIGYPATADHIRDLSGIRPELSREVVAMQPGDEALVVRLKYRIADPALKKTHQPGPEDWEYGVLVMEESVR